MQTKREMKDNVIFLSIEGSVNSSNAHELEAAMADMPGDSLGVMVDANGLEYVSSAGLRVLLGVKKRCGEKKFGIFGVNPDVMNIFNVTGFSEIMDITPAARRLSVEGCEVIGHGACGECFRIDEETIIKLYYANTAPEIIEHEKALAKKAFVMGIPTAISYDIVEAAGRRGVVYELIRSKTLAEMIRSDESKTEEYVAMYADVCKKIHAIHTNDPEIPSFKSINRVDIDNLTCLTDEEKAVLYRFLELVPESDTCIHGDLNINNIMVQNGECCLIDMGELSTGIPLFDISRITFSMVYANPEPGEMNTFYKMPSEKVTQIFNMFLRDYYGCETFEEAQKKYPELEWLYPLAWFRCCTSMLKGTRWPENKRQLAMDLLKNKLTPFVRAMDNK